MTAMTQAECARLGILSDRELSEMGECASSIAFIRERAEAENPTPLRLDMANGSTITFVGVSEDRVESAVDRIESGESLLNVFADLCAPMEKL